MVTMPKRGLPDEFERWSAWFLQPDDVNVLWGPGAVLLGEHLARHAQSIDAPGSTILLANVLNDESWEPIRICEDQYGVVIVFCDGLMTGKELAEATMCVQPDGTLIVAHRFEPPDLVAEYANLMVHVGQVPSPVRVLKDERSRIKHPLHFSEIRSDTRPSLTWLTKL